MHDDMLTYADFRTGRTVYNRHTSETGTITGTANALVEITLCDGDEITVTPNEARNNWRKGN
jgi:hypothetical protein